MNKVIKGNVYVPIDSDNPLEVIATDDFSSGIFKGIVIEGNSVWDVGTYSYWDSASFKVKESTCETANKLKPKQYDIGIDSFERAKANMCKEEIIGACKLNIDKYTWRKKGTDKEDLQKLKDYADLWLWAIENK